MSWGGVGGGVGWGGEKMVGLGVRGKYGLSMESGWGDVG